jgi:WD40 repeat protein
MVAVAERNFGIQRVIQWRGAAPMAAQWLQKAVVSTDKSGDLRVWDPQTGQGLSETHVSTPIGQLASSVQSPLVASADDRGGLAIWDLSDPRHPVRSDIAGPSSLRRDLVAVGFSSRDTQIIVVSRTGLLQRIDVATHRVMASLPVRSFRGRLSWQPGSAPLDVQAAAISPSYGSVNTIVFVAASRGGVAKLDLNSQTGRTVIPQSQIAGTPTAAAAEAGSSPSVVLATTTGLVRMDGATHNVTRALGPPVVGAALSGSNIVVGTAQGVRVEASDQPPTAGVDVTGRPVTAIASGPGGITALGADGSISLIAPDASGIALSPGQVTNALTFDPLGNAVLTSGIDANHIGELRKIAPSAPSPAGTPEADIRTYHPSSAWWPQAPNQTSSWYVNAIAADMQFVAAAGQDPNGIAVVLVWNAQSTQPLARLPLATGGVNTSKPAIVSDLLLLPRRHLLVAYSPVQQLVVVWSTDSWQQLAAFPVGPAGGLSVDPTESTLVVPSLSDQLSGLAAGQTTSRLLFFNLAALRPDHHVTTNGVYRASYSPDGQTLATLEDGGTLRLLSADGRHPAHKPIHIDDQQPRALAWRPDGKLIALALSDQGTILVDPTSGRLSDPLPPPTNDVVEGLQWSPDGHVLAATNGIPEGSYDAEAEATFWALGTSALLQRMCQLAGIGIDQAEWRSWVGPDIPYTPICAPAEASPAPAVVPQPAPAHPEVAYQRRDELDVADLAGQSVRVGTGADTYASVSFHWSSSGALSWIAGGDLHVIVPGSAAPMHWPCPCSGGLFDGTRILALENDGSAILAFTPGRPEPVRLPIKGLPSYSTGLLGRFQGVSLASAYFSEETRATPYHLFRIDRGGQARLIPLTDAGTLYGPTAATPSGDKLAFVASVSGGACYTAQHLGVFNFATGRVDLPSMPRFSPSRTIRSLTWSRHGGLFASIGPSCTEQGRIQSPSAGGVFYKLVGSHLQRAGSTPFDSQPGSAATAFIQSPESQAMGGTLSLRASDGHTVHIADGVTSFSVRP